MTLSGRRQLSVAKGLLLALTSALWVAGPGASASSPPSTGSSDATSRAVPNELLVGYQPGATPEVRAAVRRRVDAYLEERVVPAGAGQAEVELVRIPPGLGRAAIARQLETDPAVVYAEPNWIYDHDATPSDPYFVNGSLWGMSGDSSTPANQFGSQAAEAWAAGNTGSSSVYIGVIDEGIQYTHSDLAGQVGNPGDPTDGIDNDGNGYIDDSYGWDFEGNNNSVYDGGLKGNLDDHGTHVAGTIGAKANGSGVVGVSSDVRLISGKFLGRRGGTTANAIKATDYFTNLKVRNGLNVVATNNSWGGGGYSQGLYEAIERANAASILFVAAAGNGGGDQVGDDNDSVPHYPSSYTNSNIISVAAITAAGARSSFSNYGLSSVDIGAPGSGIWSTTAPNKLESYSGTSMATPHVTGGAALYAATHPGATVAQIRTAILGSAVATPALAGRTTTGGRLDVSGF